jgi:UDP-N-acetylglucosamine transferase subunit ALG13
VIFVITGSVFPFDRLIRAMDDWAAVHAAEDTFAQIGAGAYEPAHMRWVRRLQQAEFARTIAAARLIVAHAGMGSTITAGQFGKPIVLLPRVKRLGEHNTDHQVATANWLRGKPGVYVADTDADLGMRIEEALAAGAVGAPRLAPYAPPEFIARIRACVLGRD